MKEILISEYMSFIKSCKKASKIYFLSEECKKELTEAAEKIQELLNKHIEKSFI